MRPHRPFAFLVLFLAGCKTCSHCEHGDQESIVVRAPQQKVIVEQPAPVAAAPAPTCAPVGVPTAPVAAPPPMMGYPHMAAPMTYGAPPAYGAPFGATVRERTGLGFVIDHFNIPIPF